MKESFLLFIFLCFCSNVFAQINKHHWEVNTAVFVDEPFMSTGLDYYLNKRIKKNSFWSFKFSGGVAYSIKDLDDDDGPDSIIIPYVVAGVDYNVSTDGINFFNVGLGVFYIIPEFHFGIRHVNPENNYSFRFYFSDISDFRDHYLSVGVGFSVFMNRKGLKKKSS